MARTSLGIRRVGWDGNTSIDELTFYVNGSAVRSWTTYSGGLGGHGDVNKRNGPLPLHHGNFSVGGNTSLSMKDPLTDEWRPYPAIALGDSVPGRGGFLIHPGRKTRGCIGMTSSDFAELQDCFRQYGRPRTLHVNKSGGMERENGRDFGQSRGWIFDDIFGGRDENDTRRTAREADREEREEARTKGRKRERPDQTSWFSDRSDDFFQAVREAKPRNTKVTRRDMDDDDAPTPRSTASSRKRQHAEKGEPDWAKRAFGRE